MGRRYQGKRKLRQIWIVAMAVCVCIIVIGGSFLGIRALLQRVGGDPAQTEPNARPTSGVENTLQPELSEAEKIRAMTFADVSSGAPCHDAIAYAVSRGYFPDVIGGVFDPERLVTNNELSLVMGTVMGEDYVLVTDDAGRLANRQILAGFLVAAATKLELDMSRAASLESYPDAGALEPEIRAGMAWALDAGLFDPIVSARIHPELAISRAQLAQVLLKLDQLRPECEPARELNAGTASPTYMMDEKTLADLQSSIETSIKRHGAPGAQVAIIKGGEVVAELTAGWATKNTDAMTTEHKMRVASISKVAVGMEIMALAEEGAVDLDKPIGEYWGASFVNPSYPDDPITMRNIMTHTSSIIAAGDNTSRAYADVKALLSSNRGYTATKPGDFSGWAYNNYAFSVMGQTAELATGKTMDQMLNEQFADALGIDAAYEPGGIRNTNLLTTLYKEDGTPWRTPADLKQNLPYAPGENSKYFAGGLTISAGDLGRLVAIMANDGEYQGLRLLKPETVERMEVTISEPNPEEGYYQAFPLDYQPGLYGRTGIYYHNGNAYGAFTCASYDPHTGDGVVVLTNGAYPAKRDGVYIVCNEINAAVYDAIQ